MVRSVAGIEVGEPGFRKIIFKPRPGGSVTEAAARLQTVSGGVAIGWKRKAGQFEVKLEIPEGTEGSLDLDNRIENSPEGAIPPGKHAFTFSF